VITIGVDAHKSMNAAFALDDAGKELENWEGPNTEAGGRACDRACRGPSSGTGLPGDTSTTI
jgi:hypothetical protein